MAKEYTLPGGRKIRRGPFSLNGYQFPENWFDIAGPDDLAAWGITLTTVSEPTPEPLSTAELARAKLEETQDKLIEFLETDGSVPPQWRSYRSELRKALRGERPDLPQEPD